MSYFSNSFDGKIVELLMSGGVGFMPADTIYGLSCRALDETAVKRLRKIKSRSLQKPLIVLFSDYSQLEEIGMPTTGLEIIKNYWPGPISLEWNASNSPLWLHPGTDTFAIRMPAKQELTDLINKIGPITSTSANPEGEPPAMSVNEAEKYFGDQLDFYVDIGETKSPISSTLVRETKGRLEVLRQGAVKIDEEEMDE